MASPPAQWAILAIIPRVSGTDEELGGADLSLKPATPPIVTILTVPPRVAPDPTTPDNFPYVLAADGGLLLLSASQSRPTGPLVVGKTGDEFTLWRSLQQGYFVCDTTSATAFRLPDPEEPIKHSNNLGVAAARGGNGHYAVAELQPIIGSDRATLLCYSSETGKWAKTDLEYPVPCQPLESHRTISHQGKLWWVDLSWGILTCDPFDDMPVLSFVPLPEGKTQPSNGTGEGEIEKRRCVQLSDGKLRFVEITPAIQRSTPRVLIQRLKNVPMRRGRCAPRVSMWTLANPEDGEWAPEYDVSFDTLWADESYKATELPEKAPVLALVHPKNPDVVYFFLEEHIFSVDVRARRVMQYHVYELVDPPSDIISSGFVNSPLGATTLANLRSVKEG